MPTNLGPTQVKGYDSNGKGQWFEGALPDGYAGSPPEAKEPEMPVVDPVIPAPVPEVKEATTQEEPVAKSKR